MSETLYAQIQANLGNNSHACFKQGLGLSFAFRTKNVKERTWKNKLKECTIQCLRYRKKTSGSAE